MGAGTKDIKKLAQVYLREQGFYSGAIDGDWGELSEAAFERYSAHLRSRGLEIGGEEVLGEDAVPQAVSGVVVLDPGHGGDTKTGGSSPNNAISASGVLEKTMTLDLAKRIKKQLNALAEGIPGSNIKVFMTRAGDTNLGLNARAQLAEKKDADVFLSIHFNGFNGAARGTETWILSAADGNRNAHRDRRFAERVQAAMFNAIGHFDPDARDRGVKDNQRLGVLKHVSLGNSRTDQDTRACLIEVEFIDHPAVDALLNTGDNAKEVREAIATALVEAIVEDLQVNR
jgi:N-acetylmuramoyl-L-alanine amidase